ncbi:MAG: GAF domain-containing protein, partial [Nitrospirae bacterium]|nr:GAF domain-containing protein [Nitrospirota bacterium]
IALTLSKSLDLKTILKDALDEILEFMSVDAGVIYVINEETLEMIPVAFKNLSEEVIRDLTEVRVKVGECMCGTIAEADREVIIYENASKDIRFTRESLKKEGMEFYVGLPIKAKGKVIGVLCVINHEPFYPSPELLDILRATTVPLGLAIENSLLFENIKSELKQKKKYYNFENIITGNPVMLELLNTVRKIVDIPTTVLICGESGTGKELFARAIHYNSIRKDKPFIAINCSAIPETLLESELFGYSKGAFTGATTSKKGLIETAHGGTLFLDEINSMDGKLQAKLLRFLQEMSFYPVGSTVPVHVDVRVIAATNDDIEKSIKNGRFREDLYYRLNVVRLDIPPLRERRDDIPLLCKFFLNKYNKKLNKNIRKISDDAFSILYNYSWPGNVRELENAIEHSVILDDDNIITEEDLPQRLTRKIPSTKDGDLSLESIEKRHIEMVLALTGGNKKEASRLLGINPATLWRKLKSYTTT